MKRRRHPSQRGGKVLVLLAIMLPTLAGMMGLVLDGGMLISSRRLCQHVADAAATAAAGELREGHASSVAVATAESYVAKHDVLGTVDVEVQIPPASGKYSGMASYVQVTITKRVDTNLVRLLGAGSYQDVSVSSVAGCEDATVGASLMVLDPNPSGMTIPAIGASVPALPSLIGGLEVLGVGKVKVHGAAVVNNKWGGVNQYGEPAGLNAGPPYGIACTPIVSLSKLAADDIRVVGGVDRKDNYVSRTGQSSPVLQANRISTPDPFEGLPAPTVSSDPANVSKTNYGGKTVISLPLIPLVSLNPGIYDYIEVISGKVEFKPGIYIIRGKHPVTQYSLSVVAGEVDAPGVMFYITNSAANDGVTGGPDSGDGESTAPTTGVASLLPSVVINYGLLASKFTGLNSPSSPFHGMLIYQRRRDRRPIAIVQTNLLNSSSLNGTVYAKWAHIILAGMGTNQARFVGGTMRVIALTEIEIKPTSYLPAAQDVFLVQ